MAKKKTATDPNLTLEQLAKAYLDHIEKDGKSVGTCFSYLMELKTATAELGAETLVASLTAADIERFNNCKRVMKLKNGKPKAEPSFMKTRRVLRLALAFGEQSGLIEKSPISAKVEAEPAPTPPTSAKKERKTRVVTHQRAPEVETPTEPTPAA